ncbi:hypothetical protein RB195_008408 [Necator americanus]|uniref:Uncharacterized protein n=1 Tax=Necator americanus TaxID=51031 RepID=A0ABR1CNH1_NECAM
MEAILLLIEFIVQFSSKSWANNTSKFPEFILEKEFQCHNTALIKDVVCKTIHRFVNHPQDVRLSITVSFQPHDLSNEASHEQEAIAVIQVDKPGNFYPGGHEQRIRDKEIEVLRQVEKAKQKERREMRRLFREQEERKRKKMEQGLKRPGGTSGVTERMTKVAPPLPFKAEIRQLPTGEMYAVREWIYDRVRKSSPKRSVPKVPPSTEPSPALEMGEKQKSLSLQEIRKPSLEEMPAVREVGEPRDDVTDRDVSSLEPCDIESYIEQPNKSKFTYTALPSDSRIEAKEPLNVEGSIKLEDDGRSAKVVAYISVG